jgi:hypothetical protein
MQGALGAGAQLAPDGSLAKPATADMADPYAVADMQTAQQQLQAPQGPLGVLDWTHAIAGAAGMGQQFQAPSGGLPPYNDWDPAVREAYSRAGVSPPNRMRPPDVLAGPNIYQGGQWFNPGGWGYPAPAGRMPLSQFAQGGWGTGQLLQQLLQNRFNAPLAQPDVVRALNQPSGIRSY